MSNSSGYSFYLSKWEKHQNQILQVRDTVFIQELGFPTNQITQSSDPDCYHVLAYSNDGEVVGAGCIHPNGEIRQLAVLKPWRGRTVGKAILVYLMHIAKTLRLNAVWVNALENQTGLYQSKGFQPTDQVSVIDGFRFQKMVYEINLPPSAVH